MNFQTIESMDSTVIKKNIVASAVSFPASLRIVETREVRRLNIRMLPTTRLTILIFVRPAVHDRIVSFMEPFAHQVTILRYHDG